MEPLDGKHMDQTYLKEKPAERKEWITSAMAIFKDLSSTFSLTSSEFQSKVEVLHASVKQRLNTKHPEYAEKLSMNQEKVQELYEQLKNSKENLVNVAVNSEVFKSMIPVQEKAGQKMKEMYNFFYERIVPYMEHGYEVTLTEPAKTWLTNGIVTMLPEEEQEEMKAKYSAIPDEVCKPLMTGRKEIGLKVYQTFNLEEMDLLLTVIENPKVFEVAREYGNLCKQAGIHSDSFRETIVQGLSICRDKMKEAST